MKKTGKNLGQPERIQSLAVLKRRVGRRRIAVLMGGQSAERRISLLSGRAVLKTLRELGLNATGVDLKRSQDLLRLARTRPEVAVICLHGPGGEDGKIQGALEWLGIPYTDSGVLASALAMDKYRSKQILEKTGLPTAPSFLVNDDLARLPASLKPPLVVKPNNQGSALGISIVKTQTKLARALVQARRYGSEVLVEKYLSGREISVGVLGCRALPVIEIVPKKAFYDFEAKYAAGMSEHIIPARISAAARRTAQALALRAHRALGCRGATRVDLITGRSGRMSILEVNTIPGLTATSLLPEAARHAGVSFGQLILWLILDALRGAR